MLKLSGRIIPISNIHEPGRRQVFPVVTSDVSDLATREKSALFSDDPSPPHGFGAYLRSPAAGALNSEQAFRLSDGFDYLAEGDLVSLDSSRNSIRVLYRRNSLQNYFLTTERCDNYCLMCSQPPKNIDDAWLADEILDAIPLISPETRELGFSGGEPTLLGDRLIDILEACKKHLPSTVLHVLSNGRRFSDITFARKWASVEHFDLMVGIPLYASVASIHDYVVQARGAFDETIRGILNLKRLNQPVEIRVVLHKQTIPHLARLAEFIARNLLFVDKVALMGLEMTGFTKANLDALWIDPAGYQAELREATAILTDAGISTAIYNHQLCLVPRDLWPYTVKSISDWKNEYFPECDSCTEKDRCGGFFASAHFKHSDNIRAIVHSPE